MFKIINNIKIVKYYNFLFSTEMFDMFKKSFLFFHVFSQKAYIFCSLYVFFKKLK